jgi:hypothetical protein
MSRKKVLVSELPVMKAHCKTCPFRPNEHGHFTDGKLANRVIERTLFNGQQICHGTEGPNREGRNRCKGAFDFLLPIYEAIGLKDIIK